MQQILWIGFIQSLIAGIIIAVKRPKHLSHHFLAAWLCLVAAEMGIELIKMYFGEYLPAKLPFRFVTFTYGPLLYLYTRSLISERTEFKKSDFLHFIPFVMFLTLSFLVKEDPSLINLPRFLQNNPLLPVRLFYGITFYASISVYSILVFVLIDRHRKNLKNQLSYTSEKVTLSWLMVISITFYVSYHFTFFFGGFQIMNLFLALDAEVFSYSGLTILAYAYTIFGLQQPEIFSNNISVVENLDQKAPKYVTSSLSEKKIQSYNKKLLKLLDDKKVYLKNDLSLADVAKELGIPKHHLTQAINEGLNKNFYTLINEYRVNEVIRLFKDPKNKNLTLLAIAFDSGFNSKSSFNSIFKKITGETPSEYQKKMNVEN